VAYVLLENFDPHDVLYGSVTDCILGIGSLMVELVLNGRMIKGEYGL